MAQSDLGGECFKVLTFLPARGRLAQIAIEHFNAIGMPAQGLGALNEGTLRELAVEMVAHLFGARLANVNNRFAFKMSRSRMALKSLEVIHA
jgi:hypothetical protein